jgi:hypothetical protein
MVGSLFLPNAVLDLASGIVALLVSYYSFQYNKLAESSLLKFISFGFMLLGIGLLSQSSVLLLFSFNVAQITDRRVLGYAVSVAYVLLQLVAYFVIALEYGRRAYAPKVRVGGTGGVSLMISILVLLQRAPTHLLLGTIVFDVSQLVVIILLAFIVFQGVLIYSGTKSRLSELVLLGFVLILVSHIAILASSLLFSDIEYLAGDIIQFAGFLSLLYFVIQSGRIGTA